MARVDAAPAGWTNFTVGSISFTVESDYRPHRLLGCGAMGSVCQATILATGEEVAIKKIANVLDESSSSLREAKSALREVLLLRHLSHENVISIQHLMLPPQG